MAVDLSQATGFDWDDGNSRKSVEKHGITPAEAEQVFVNRPLTVAEDAGHSAEEARYHALGRTTDNKLLHVTFTLRHDGSLIRVISARAMNRKERAIYDGASREEEEA